jgi:hypothetical protein
MDAQRVGDLDGFDANGWRSRDSSLKVVGNVGMEREDPREVKVELSVVSSGR